VNEKAKAKCAEIVKQLRDLGINAEYDVMDRSLGKQLQYVNAKGVKFSMVVGDNEMKSGVVKIRNMISGNEREVELRSLQKIRDIIKSE
jgi:histidyl-tRNA synthetase